MYIFHVMQRDTSGLTVENKELKLRLQAMEQQAHLRDGMHFVILCLCHFIGDLWSLKDGLIHIFPIQSLT